MDVDKIIQLESILLKNKEQLENIEKKYQDLQQIQRDIHKLYKKIINWLLFIIYILTIIIFTYAIKSIINRCITIA
tara:strand:- start:106 stop:333 length:228 start_codon:yes stop_codon:yes gene_type:complete